MILLDDKHCDLSLGYIQYHTFILPQFILCSSLRLARDLKGRTATNGHEQSCINIELTLRGLSEHYKGCCNVLFLDRPVWHEQTSHAAHYKQDVTFSFMWSHHANASQHLFFCQDMHMHHTVFTCYWNPPVSREKARPAGQISSQTQICVHKTDELYSMCYLFLRCKNRK